MTSIIHEIDPDGDVVLILRNPNAPFAVWDECVGPLAAPAFDPSDLFWTSSGKDKENKKKSKEDIPSFKSLDPPAAAEVDPLDLFTTSSRKKKKNKKKNKGGIPSFKSLDPGAAPAPEEPAPEEPGFDVPPHEDAPVPEGSPALNATTDVNDSSVSIPKELASTLKVEVRMRPSSKHLTLASEYFKTILRGPWKEITTSSESCYTIDESEWDTEAMLILMNIIHGRARNVPKFVSLEMLAKLAVLVDYYKCHEAVTFYADYWIRNLIDIPKQYCRDLVLWLAISWVFSHGPHFEAVTKVAIEQSNERFRTLKLPIPERVVETIDQQREEFMDQIISGLHDLVSYFHRRENCSFECSAILLGALTKQMHVNGLLDPKPIRPFIGYSTAGTTAIIRDFKSPVWGNERNYYSRNHQCTITVFMNPTVNSFVDRITGLNLEDIQARLG